MVAQDSLPNLNNFSDTALIINNFNTVRKTKLRCTDYVTVTSQSAISKHKANGRKGEYEAC